MSNRFKPVKGNKSRRYIDTNTGENISRREMEKRKNGGISNQERAKIRKQQGVKNTSTFKGQSKYSKLVKEYKQKTAEKTGKKAKDIKVRGDSDEAKKFRELAKRLNKVNSGKNVDKSANGELAKILVELNFRSDEWNFPVGETP